MPCMVAVWVAHWMPASFNYSTHLQILCYLNSFLYYHGKSVVATLSGGVGDVLRYHRLDVEYQMPDGRRPGQPTEKRSARRKIKRIFTRRWKPPCRWTKRNRSALDLSYIHACNNETKHQTMRRRCGAPKPGSRVRLCESRHDYDA
jgi:hypothetical protein